jgi:hypothetical protein
MNLGKEFEQYAVKHRGISSATLHNYQQQGFTNLTPYIIEERPLNVASMDVFSRLMMDRIIFLGEGQYCNCPVIISREHRPYTRYTDVHQQSRRQCICRLGHL